MKCQTDKLQGMLAYCPYISFVSSGEFMPQENQKIIGVWFPALNM